MIYLKESKALSWSAWFLGITKKYELRVSFKENIKFFCFSFIAMIVAFLFQNYSKNWVFNMFNIWFKIQILGNSKSFTIFDKTLFNISAVLVSLFINSPSSLIWMLSLFTDLSGRRSLIVFQNFLLSIMPSRLNCHSNSF